MNAKSWVDWFEQNRANYVEPDWTSACRLTETRRQRLIESLAIFQLGESGGGTRLRRFVLRETAAEPIAGDYSRAVDLFIAEENRHAELLGKCLDYLGGERRHKQWSNSLFRGVRSLVNLEFNIQVLLTAELIAEAYYGFLHRMAGDPVLESVCGKILRDEVKHIGFHAAFYRHRQARWLPVHSLAWALQFQAIFRVVQEVVWKDHGPCLRELGVSRAAFFQRSNACCRGFLRRVELGAAEPAGETALA